MDTSSQRSILLLDDDPDVGIAAQLLLQRRVAPVTCLRRPAEIIAQGNLSAAARALGLSRAARRESVLHPIEPPPPPDTKRLALLEAQLEHLPVATWVLIGERSLQPLSSRARRLLAPGGVRNPEDLHRLLRDSDRNGPVVLETERGSERWQLQRQPLALDGQHQTLLVLMALENELEFEMQNAEQATAEESNPRLWVLARQSRGGRLQISVRDNGPGVPAGLERQIFLPFFSTREGGHGIGLTVVRQLIYGMGGRVRHVRPIEKGAAFVLLF